MFKIPDKDVGIVIHDVLNVIGILKNIECEILDCPDRKEKNEKCIKCKTRANLLHDCEIKLIELRQEILSSLEDEKGE